MTAGSDVKRWRRLALAAGWRIVHVGPHEKWWPANSSYPVVVVSTSRVSVRNQRNIRAGLRRSGLLI